MKQYETFKDSGVEWIGEIPEHWKVARLKFNAKVFTGNSLNDSLKEKYRKNNTDCTPYIGSKDLETETNLIDYDNGIRISKEDESNFKLGRNGSAVICIEGGSAGKKIGFLEKDTFFVNKLACLDSGNKFTYYFIQSNFFKNQFNSNLSGLIPGVSVSSLKNLFITSPPLQEQTQIANYLNDKTAQLDTLITKKEQLISLFQEERTAMINQAVTKGLDLNVPMKDSGIEWLGEIPAHWKSSKIGYLSRVIRGASPRPAGDPLLFNGDFMPWITVKEVTNADGKFINSTESFLTELGAKQTRILEPETLILSNSGATLGVPRITLIEGAINDGSVAFLDLQVEREFLYYFFTTHTAIYREEASGYGQPNLNTQIVKSTSIPLPSKEEQTEIISFVEKEIKRYDEIVIKYNQEIELLKEYKTALISEVVTGKVDVREEVLAQ
ncbi:restriction endonuclease subunit S [Polaribacter sp. IC063]|uniref:restriction endonuclease subunit S n=1 Tax=Polaribacter sp. IC063 TaxID=57031 RepID=UPI0011BE8C9C|nr:restriction endonuclease subunit S [Polaribacter sp. IC063]TXD53649.1 restriction endonuclease subunit S [Polaribacter sp. IC063]